jgi:hypothetical protein
MAFPLSPGVSIKEIDLTTVVPNIATTDGAFAGVFRWGPVDQRILIDSENLLVSKYGKPTNYNAETFFTAANFLAYGNRLYVSRAANTTGSTPYASFATTANSTVTNNIFTTSNTTPFSVGMYLTQISNSSTLATGTATYITAVNSTAIVLSKNTASNGTVSLYFGNPETCYTACAFDEDDSTTAFAANLVNQIVLNSNRYDAKDGTFDTDVIYVAKYPGEMGNSLRVSVCDTSGSFQSNVALSNATVNTTVSFTIGSNTATAAFTGTSNAAATTVDNYITIGDQVLAGNSTIGLQYLQVTSTNVASNATHTILTLQFEDPYRLKSSFSSNTIQRYWEFFNVVDVAPGQSDYVRLNGNTSANDEVHVVIVDDRGDFTGTPGTILEVYKQLSRATDAKNNDGSSSYYKDVINQSSQFVWWTADRATSVSNTAVNLTSSTSTSPGDYQMRLGSSGYDESNVSLSTIASAFDLFNSTEEVDISLIMQGKPRGGTTVQGGETISNYQLANYIIDNICEVRKDCVGFITPDKSKVFNNYGNEATSLVNWRNALHSTSYAFMDSGYKYQYDRYNDIYRWVPLNGDMAGLCARTDITNDAWWSPAGFNRGQIKNLVKLSYNPRKAERDVIYPSNVNPVVTFPGQGTILFGDKTLLAKPSAFDRINVRRLFIVLEKAISQAAKYSLFEFNDAFTRAQFKNLVVPYLRTVQGRRGITDFLVVCDETNNTPQIIDTNQFVGDIYIKPARSINFIQLNFVAVGTGVQFSEVVGNF